MKFRNLGIGLTLSVLASFSFIACKKKSTATYNGSTPLEAPSDEKNLKPVKNDWYVTALPSNPQTMNPVTYTDAYSPMVFQNIFEPLFTFDIETNEPRPRIAQSWKASDDGLIYDFFLNKTARFQDGHPVTAEDVKFTFDTIKDPKTDDAPQQSYFAALEKTEIVDPYHVRFKMKNKYWLNEEVIGTTFILPKHIYGVGDFNTNPANRKPIGSGPYKFVKWDDGRLIELERDPNYWAKDMDYWKDRFNFNKLLFRIITEDAVRVMAIKKGEIDGLDLSTTQFIHDFGDPKYEKEFYKLRFDTVTGNGYGYIGMNEKNPLFTDKETRQAMSYAMPRDEINKKLYGGLRVPAVANFPHSSPKLDPSLKPIPYDIDKARELLAKAGWTEKNGLLERNGKKFQFELLFPSGNSDGERIALIYQQSLRNLGIEMNIRTLEWTVFIKQLHEQKFDAVILAWGPSHDDDPYQIFHSSQSQHGGSNYVSYSNKQADALMEKARGTLNKDERNKIFQEFSRVLADDAPYVFLFEAPNLFIGSRRFKKVLPPGKLGLDQDRWFTPLGMEKYKETAAQ